MEKVTLSNGRIESFLTSQNDYWKFFLCETYQQAVSLKNTLTEIGKYCEIGDSRHGWFVREKIK